MNLTNTYSFAFSVKGTTETLINEMGTVFPHWEHHDLTKNSYEKVFADTDLVVVGAPVFGGRIPSSLAKKLKGLKGNCTPAVAVVVYGNRAYDDALLELKNILSEQGFKVVAGIVYVAEHSLAPNVATGRPNANDLTIARMYSERVLEKLASVEYVDCIKELDVPGNFPYVKTSDSHKAQKDSDLNPLMRKLANFLLPRMFKGEKNPEIYI